jgi:DNA-binding NtrC family response regulator
MTGVLQTRLSLETLAQEVLKMRISVPAEKSSHPPHRLLSVSPFYEDHELLRAIVEPLNVIITESCSRRDSLFAMLSQFAVILCEARLNWKDILSYLAEVLDPPPLILTSRMDERLWAEALNLGSWDVLIKPFDRTEVRRVVTSALYHRSGLLRGAPAA